MTTIKAKYLKTKEAGKMEEKMREWRVRNLCKMMAIKWERLDKINEQTGQTPLFIPKQDSISIFHFQPAWPQNPNNVWMKRMLEWMNEWTARNVEWKTHFRPIVTCCVTFLFCHFQIAKGLRQRVWYRVEPSTRSSSSSFPSTFNVVIHLWHLEFGWGSVDRKMPRVKQLPINILYNKRIPELPNYDIT